MGAAARIRADATRTDARDVSRTMTARLSAQLEPTAQHSNDLHQGLVFTA